MITALSLFGELNEDDIQWIFETAEEQSVLSQATITQEGLQPHAMYVMLQGLAEVVVSSAADRRLATLGPGELIGEISLLEGRPASATVRAVENSLLLVIPRELLAARLRGDPPFAARWYRAFALILASRLRERVLALTQQLRAREAHEETVSEAWTPLRQALHELKLRFGAADQESLHTGQVSEALSRQIVEEFLRFVELLHRAIGEPSGLDQYVCEELGGRVKLELLPYVLLAHGAEHTYAKPRGYAGDFVAVEIMYQNQPRGAGRLGPLVDRWFLSLPATVAVRNRRGLLAEEIRRTWEAATEEVVYVTSLACGPAEEVFDVLATRPEGRRLQATLIDIDPEALAFVEDKARQRGVLDRLTLVPGNLVYLAVGRHRLTAPPQDLIYSVGLIDYFNDAFAIKLISFAHSLLRPGGRLILGNFHPANTCKALMDYVLDWKLIHRTEEDMHRLFRASRFARPCTNICFEAQGINLFAECVKE
jgi:CRP-like cAMP-binding protein/SAM-dependent methyltransferase